MVMFHSFLYAYQRVWAAFPGLLYSPIQKGSSSPSCLQSASPIPLRLHARRSLNLICDHNGMPRKKRGISREKRSARCQILDFFHQGTIHQRLVKMLRQKVSTTGHSLVARKRLRDLPPQVIAATPARMFHDCQVPKPCSKLRET